MARNLSSYVAEMVEIERQLERALTQLSESLGNQVEASNLISKFLAMAKSQRDILEDRFKRITDDDIPARESATIAPSTVSGKTPPSTETTASTALQALYAAFSRAAFGYGLLHTRAHRFFDGRTDGSTSEIAERHSQAYTEAAQALFEIVPDIAIRELNLDGQPCICNCPSCGLGICLCWHTHTDGSTHTVSNSESLGEASVRIRAPKPKSEAERIGLRDGDILLTVDDEIIRSSQNINPALRKHESGDEIILKIQRDGGEGLEVTATAP